MDLTLITGDALCYLMKYVHPEDRFNLILSGVLPEFRAITDIINITERYY